MKIQKKYRYLSIILIFICSWSSAQESQYQFEWMKIPVAQLLIKINKYSSQNNEAKPTDIRFNLNTQGPLKLYRNYSSEVRLRINTIDSWDYYLTGIDRGQPEEKAIKYFVNKAPIIKKFIDDDGVLPINIDIELDKHSVDPFSVLLGTIEQLISEQRCKNEFSVMDGKRRYRVIVDQLDKKNELKKENTTKRIIYVCKYSFSNLQEEPRKWPFNNRNRSFIIWFASDLDYKPMRMYFKTPIGDVIGRLITE